MQSITVDILNVNAFKLLQDMELLKLIRLHKDSAATYLSSNAVAKYKGAMTKQTRLEIEEQLNEFYCTNETLKINEPHA